MKDRDILDPATESANGEERMWPMGAVTRRTGIGEHTLRAWERRFGFPTPHRLESGHRRYSGAQVKQLQLVAKALGCGHRAGDVVPLSGAELRALLQETGAGEPTGTAFEFDAFLAEVIDASRNFDRASVAAILRRDATVFGIPEFLRERVSPLLTAIGEAWSRAEIGIRHEHFFSEVLEDELRALRAPLQPAAGGRPVVLASLPNEPHSLGLQIAALAITVAGRSVRVLGPHLPVDEIVHAAEHLGAAAVGLSVSLYGVDDETRREVEVLRAALPNSVELWIGGAGSQDLGQLPAGVAALPGLDELDRAVENLAG